MVALAIHAAPVHNTWLYLRTPETSARLRKNDSYSCFEKRSYSKEVEASKNEKTSNYRKLAQTPRFSCSEASGCFGCQFQFDRKRLLQYSCCFFGSIFFFFSVFNSQSPRSCLEEIDINRRRKEHPPEFFTGCFVQWVWRGRSSWWFRELSSTVCFVPFPYQLPFKTHKIFRSHKSFPNTANLCTFTVHLWLGQKRCSVTCAYNFAKNDWRGFGSFADQLL